MSAKLRLPDHLALPALVAGALAVAWVAVLLVGADGGASRLVHAAPPWTDPAAAPASLTIVAPDDAFDGQFFYRLAVEPWSTAEQVAGIELDLPALRHQRIGYPALAWLASGGGAASRLPTALVALNVVGFAALGGLGGALANDAGRHAGWGLLAPLYPGFVYSLAFDLAEITALAFVLAGLLALRRRRLLVATALLAAAVLTRETTAVVPLGVAAAWGWPRYGPPGRVGRRPSFAELAPGVVPLVVALVLQVALAVAYGELPLVSSGDKNVRIPFAGLVDGADAFWPPTSGAAVFRWLSLAALVAVVGAAGVAWRGSTRPRHEKLAWVPAVALLPLLSGFIWAGATSFMRAGTEAYVLSVLVLLGAGLPVLPAVAAGSATLWALSAASEVGA
ncbi:hypothetical protein BH20ACT2_BH20ACT2_06020 [soil metagenome]